MLLLTHHPLHQKKNYVLFGRHVPKTMSEFYELVEHNSKRKENVKNEQSYINIKIFNNFFFNIFENL